QAEADEDREAEQDPEDEERVPERRQPAPRLSHLGPPADEVVDDDHLEAGAHPEEGEDEGDQDRDDDEQRDRRGAALEERVPGLGDPRGAAAQHLLHLPRVEAARGSRSPVPPPLGHASAAAPEERRPPETEGQHEPPPGVERREEQRLHAPPGPPERRPELDGHRQPPAIPLVRSSRSAGSGKAPSRAPAV